jgi:hypothetical protein
MFTSAPPISTLSYAAIVAWLARELELSTVRLEPAAAGRIRVLADPDETGARYVLLSKEEADKISESVTLAGWLAPHTIVRAKWAERNYLAGLILARDVAWSDSKQVTPAGTIIDQVASQTYKIADNEPVYLRRPPDALWALACVFARMQETVITRLNRVPENLLHAFLSLAGTRLQPPSPARVPVTFQVAGGALAQVRVPAGIPVAAPAADGRPEVIFATERALPLTAARLVAALALEPGAARYTDHGDALREGRSFAPFIGIDPYEHCLYLAHTTLFTLPFQLRFVVKLHPSSADPDNFEAVMEAMPRELTYQTTDGSTVTTHLAVEHDHDSVKLHFLLSAPVKPGLIGGIEAPWLMILLNRTKLPVGGVTCLGPYLDHVRAESASDDGEQSIAPDVALLNETRVDLNRPFLPFGEHPCVGDVLYLRFPDVLLQSAGTVALVVSARSLKLRSLPEVVWESWNGHSWVKLAIGVAGDQAGVVRLAQEGEFALTLSNPAVPIKIAGVVGCWLRARIESGDFGIQPRYVLAHKPNEPNTKPYFHPNTERPLFELENPGGAPPFVMWLRLKRTLYTPDLSFVAVRNGPNLRATSGKMTHTFGDVPIVLEPALYLGFDAPFANGPVALYVGVEPVSAAKDIHAALPDPLELTWDYGAAGEEWRDLPVVDDTSALSVSGLVSFIAPADLAARTLFDRTHYWLRVRCTKGDARAIRLRRLLTNTTWAVHARTVERELLGSSDGSQHDLTLRVSAPPVLSGHVVEVRESPEADWSVWAEQPDLYAAGPRDRHYMLNQLSGELRFGNGVRGMVPPRGTNNIRISYSTGGGKAGNLPAGVISQLKVAVPYVDGVTNHEPAAGGAAPEPAARARERGSRELRHGWRAVAAQDYEDLALAATPEVARALALTPDVDPIYEQVSTEEQEAAAQVGRVRLVIVPHDDHPAPAPTPELLRRVKRFIDARRPQAIDFDVLPPVYIPVDVAATVIVRSPEDGEGLTERVKAAICRYLHPIYGGSDERGWPFGRLRGDDTSEDALCSDLYALISAVAGVDRVTQVGVTLVAPKLEPGQWRYALLSPRPPLVTLAGSRGAP